MAIYFEIQADDPGRAIRFYSEVLGWKFSEVKGLPVAYWIIETGIAPGGGLPAAPCENSSDGKRNKCICMFVRGG